MKLLLIASSASGIFGEMPRIGGYDGGKGVILKQYVCGKIQNKGMCLENQCHWCTTHNLCKESRYGSGAFEHDSDINENCNRNKTNDDCMMHRGRHYGCTWLSEIGKCLDRDTIKKRPTFKVRDQGPDPTCWAHAWAKVFVAATHRLNPEKNSFISGEYQNIVNRYIQTYPDYAEKGVPHNYRNPNNDKFLELLVGEAQKREENLVINKVPVESLPLIVVERPVLIVMSYRPFEWNFLREFYHAYWRGEHNNKVFGFSELLELQKRKEELEERFGKVGKKILHIMVITKVKQSEDGEVPIYKIQNSRGQEFGINGYFFIAGDVLAKRAESDEYEMSFYDVASEEEAVKTENLLVESSAVSPYPYVVNAGERFWE